MEPHVGLCAVCVVQSSQKFIEPAHFSGQSEQLQLESMGSQGIAIGQLGKGQQIRVTCTAKKVSQSVRGSQCSRLRRTQAAAGWGHRAARLPCLHRVKY